jgi:methyl-accepting chemotaxis protein
MTELPAWDGFWSYVHADDEAESGRFTRLARDVACQYELLTGEKINLFLDKFALEWGDQWRKKIDEGLGYVAFFIAVMTPRFFMSAECRRELQSFARMANQLGIKELVLPLYYIDVDALSDKESNDDLVSLLRQYQWVDWREIRFEDVDSKPYRKSVAALAQRLCIANRKAESTNTVETISDEFKEAADEVDDSPGILDRLAEWESVSPILTETLSHISEEIDRVGEIMRTANEEINSRASQGQTFQHRLIITTQAAAKLHNPTEELLQLSNKFTSQLHSFDDGIRALIELVDSDSDHDEDDVARICELLNSLRDLSATAREGLGSVQGMIDSMAPLEKMSRDLRSPLRVLRKGLTLLLEGIEITDYWVSLINQCSINC